MAAFIGATLLTTVLLGSAMAMVVIAGRPDTLWVILTSLAMAPLLVGPVLLGSLAAYWDSRSSSGARAVFRRWMVGTLIADAAGAIVLVLFSVLTPAPWWIPAVLIGVGAVATAVAPAAGRSVYRADDSADPPPTSVDVPKKIRVLVIVFVTTLVVGGVVLVILLDVLGADDAVFGILFALAFALLAAAFTSSLTMISLGPGVRTILGADLGRAQKISKVVVRGKDIPLDEAELSTAARYAERMPTVIGFQIANFCLTYVAILTLQVPRMISGLDTLTTFIVVLFVIGLVVLVPLQIVQLRRVQRYAREHPGDNRGMAAALLVIAGPQASGKSTVARALADDLRAHGKSVALVALDDIAEMALPTLPEWDAAHGIFASVVAQWGPPASRS